MHHFVINSITKTKNLVNRPKSREGRQLWDTGTVTEKNGWPMPGHNWDKEAVVKVKSLSYQLLANSEIKPKTF